jgi:hypothetical protein
MNSEVIQQLEKISKAIRTLEGLGVDFSLARKLAEVMKEIQLHCEPYSQASELDADHADAEWATTRNKGL